MGQNNVLGRYLIHFHILGDGCNDCYLSIQNTHVLTVTEHVEYDVTGYCATMYIEDGVEENNTISFNLEAFIHHPGEAACKGSRSPCRILDNAT